MLIKLAISLGFVIVSHFSPTVPVSSTVESETPAYAKWSRLAIQQVQIQYPNAQIIDYLYMGTRQSTEGMEATFRLWLREAGREYGVVVRVTYSAETDKLKEIQINEITPP
ncbi:hypothetical protein NCCP2716_11130 [Sporosarcina sp. NCCP-2716]|uniref:DUF3889 domain-containing protein n=1 Tax=Sporosarcina sp. NCCP-2716 TaxID=2943679 RepID=UPI0020417DC2|nr:DUF3889 domain-containing protein [Sporosarcina sp. NCCP-2716]GKV68615.1 hypothetical protein NCCP2716_11130 [Sporosarcina sp. NCCP-2716]